MVRAGSLVFLLLADGVASDVACDVGDSCPPSTYGAAVHLLQTASQLEQEQPEEKKCKMLTDACGIDDFSDLSKVAAQFKDCCQSKGCHKQSTCQDVVDEAFDVFNCEVWSDLVATHFDRKKSHSCETALIDRSGANNDEHTTMDQALAEKPQFQLSISRHSP